MIARTSITINNTEYIPAKEAEISFLIAIIGIVTGIVFGFFLLKYEFGNTNTASDLPTSVPAVLNNAEPQIYPDGPNSTIDNQQLESDTESSKEYSV